MSAVYLFHLCVLLVESLNYHIQPNYRTVCLGFSELLGKLVEKYVSAYQGYTSKKDQQRTHLMMFIQFFSDFLYKSICCEYSFELHRQVDAIQMGTHNICLDKEVDKIARAVI